MTTDVYTFAQAQWGSLHTATPGFTGANEVSGGSYTRQQITWVAPLSGGFATPGQKVSSNAQSWTGMPACTVTHFGWFGTSGASGGTWLGGGILGSSLTVPSGATVFAAIGAITASQSG